MSNGAKKLTLQNPAFTISDADLRTAIELRCSDAFNSMNIANALGGTDTVPWRAVREYTFVELVTDARARGLPVETFQASLMKEGPDPRPITDTRMWAAYLKAIASK